MLLDGARGVGLEERRDPVSSRRPDPVHPTQRGQLEEGLDGEVVADQRRPGRPLQRRPAGGDAQQGAHLSVGLGQHQGRVPRHRQRKEFQIFFSQGELFF